MNTTYVEQPFRVEWYDNDGRQLDWFDSLALATVAADRLRRRASSFAEMPTVTEWDGSRWRLAE